MTISLRAYRLSAVAIVFALAIFCGASTFAQQDDEPGGVVVSDDGGSAMTVPDGTPAELIKFIEEIAQPKQDVPEADRPAYIDNVTHAIIGAADRVLADKSASDQQLIDAIEWKMEALRTRGHIGDEGADKAMEEFLADLDFADKQAVQNTVDRIRSEREAAALQLTLVAKMRQWEQLSDAERNDTVDMLVKQINRGEPTPIDAQLLSEFADFLSDSPFSSFAVRAIDESLPALRTSQNPAVMQRVVMLEGLARRLNLPGNEMELEGTFLDGKKLDWASYRGKVVLVDFWATWCGPCRAEVPNILANYEKYHDKGFEVIGISLDERRGDAEDYVTQNNIPWPTLFHQATDQDGWANPMAVRYGITGIPTAILVDQEGKVVSMQARGPRLGAALAKLISGAGDANSAVEVTDRAGRTAQSDAQ